MTTELKPLFQNASSMSITLPGIVMVSSDVQSLNAKDIYLTLLGMVIDLSAEQPLKVLCKFSTLPGIVIVVKVHPLNAPLRLVTLLGNSIVSSEVQSLNAS